MFRSLASKSLGRFNSLARENLSNEGGGLLNSIKSRGSSFFDPSDTLQESPTNRSLRRNKESNYDPENANSMMRQSLNPESIRSSPSNPTQIVRGLSTSNYSSSSSMLRRPRSMTLRNGDTSRRTFLTRSQWEFLRTTKEGTKDGIKKLLEEKNVTLRIQRNEACFTSGSDFNYIRKERKDFSWREWLTGTHLRREYLSIPKVFPGMSADALKEVLQGGGPFQISSQNMAMPGSDYLKGYHSFIVLAIVKFEGKDYVLRVDKDDTIFTSTRREEKTKELKNAGFTKEDLEEFYNIINKVWEYQKSKTAPNGVVELNKIDQATLLGYEAERLLLHLDPLEVFLKKIRWYTRADAHVVLKLPGRPPEINEGGDELIVPLARKPNPLIWRKKS